MQPIWVLDNRNPLRDRRITEGYPPPGLTERRIQAERRGIEVVEFDFDEYIAVGTPEQTRRISKSETLQ